MTFLDRLLEPFPWLKALFIHMDQYLGPVIGSFLFLFILVVFYWTFFIVPKRIQRLFDKLSKKGYSADNPTDPHLFEIVEKLVPIYDHHPRKEHPIPPWKIIKSVSKSCKGGIRYLIYASRLQIEWSGSRGSSNSLRHCVMLLENRKLDFPEAVYLKPSSNAENEICDQRHNLQKVSPGEKAPFFDQYAFFTKSGSMEDFPGPLQETLTSLLSLFILQDSQTIHIWSANLKFCKEGWGLLSSEEIYKPEPLEKFIEAANRISDSL